MEQRKKIHSHKFTLWVGIGSILMMFAGLTSAYIVKRNQANWVTFDIPLMFWYSTVAIAASSITMFLATKAFREKEMRRYRELVTATLALGIVFVLCQVLGFKGLWDQGVTLQASVSYSFLYVIVGLHALHVVGGLIALIVLFAKAFNRTTRSYDMTLVEVVGTYWHFVDALWLYLLLFLFLIK